MRVSLQNAHELVRAGLVTHALAFVQQASDVARQQAKLFNHQILVLLHLEKGFLVNSGEVERRSGVCCVVDGKGNEVVVSELELKAKGSLLLWVQLASG